MIPMNILAPVENPFWMESLHTTHKAIEILRESDVGYEGRRVGFSDLSRDYMRKNFEFIS